MHITTTATAAASAATSAATATSTTTTPRRRPRPPRPRHYNPFRTGVFNLLSSRANLHLSYNPAGRSHCRLQNDHEHIKHHHRGMGGSPDDKGEVLVT